MDPTPDNIASPLADLISSVMLRAYETENRRQLYIWEQKAMRWLLAYMETPGRVPINAWTDNFCRLNRDLILSDQIGPINFNLRAFNERERP